jgi:hypothetical protein
MNEPVYMDNQVPLGPWIRSNQYGKRILEEKDKKYYSNPSRGSNFGQYSPPIPASMVEQMTAMKLQEEAEERAKQSTDIPTNQEGINGFQSHRYIRHLPRTEQLTYKDTMVLDKAEEVHVTGKRLRLDADTKTTQTNLMAGPAQQASQRP